MIKLKNTQIAELVNVPVSTVYNWSSGKIKIPDDAFNKIMKAEKYLNELKDK